MGVYLYLLFPHKFTRKVNKKNVFFKGVVEDVMVSTGAAKYSADLFFECKLSREVNENYRKTLIQKHWHLL